MRCHLFLIVVFAAIAVTAAAQARVATPRIQPVEAFRAPTDSAPDPRESIAAFGADADSATNLIRTLARHPAALASLGPLAGYLRDRAMATVVDQTLVALRVAWLCRSETVWAEQAEEAREFGFRDDDLRRIAEGPDAGWGLWDTVVLRAADDLHHDSILSNATWSALAQRYNARQIIDLIYTVAEHMMFAMMANSFGVQPDEHFPDRRPTDVAQPREPARANLVPLETARLEPLPVEELTETERAQIDPQGTGEASDKLLATLARFPTLYRANEAQSDYLRARSTLSGRVREMLILRIAWLCGAEYAWAQHAPLARQQGLTDDEIRDVAVGPDAGGWTRRESALLRAADELYRDDIISDATWATLAESFDEQALIDIVITVAGYRMVSVAVNSIGVQRDPGAESFPDVERG